jgi:Tol biopolymer transport system component
MDTGRIVFNRFTESADQLVLLDLDAPGGPTEVVLLSDPDETPAFSARWSHRSDTLGRRWILFRDPGGGLSAVKEDGSALHQILPDWEPGVFGIFGFQGAVTLSPDDQWLAYPTRNPQGFAIQPFDWTIGTVDGDLILLVNLDDGSCPDGPAWGVETTWAPDGSSIAFQGKPSLGPSVPAEIYRIDLTFSPSGVSASCPVNITQTPDLSEFEPDWSAATTAWPDGRIVFGQGFSNGRGSVAHVNPFDPADRQSLGVRGSRNPTWSPDAARIAFEMNRHSGQNQNAELFAANPDGSGLAQLTDNDFADDCPAWRPAEFVP